MLKRIALLGLLCLLCFGGTALAVTTWQVKFVPTADNKDMPEISSPAKRTFTLTGGKAFNVNRRWMAISTDTSVSVDLDSDEGGEFLSYDLSYTGAASSHWITEDLITAPIGKSGTVRLLVALSLNSQEINYHKK